MTEVSTTYHSSGQLDTRLVGQPALQARLDEYWSRRAPSYDADQRRQERADDDRRAWSRVWSAALPPTPAQVIDLGTGSGYVAWLLHDLGYQVTGVDSAPGMIAQARTHQDGRLRGDGPEFLLGDALAPPCPPGAADAVTARYVLWTMRDPLAALQAWRRLLRPGGTLAVVDGLWFPDGLPSPRTLADGLPSATPTANDGQVVTLFADAYATRGPDELPLAGARSIQESAAVLVEAGFADVEVTPLTEIFELDLRYGVTPGHQVTQQYLLRGIAD